MTVVSGNVSLDPESRRVSVAGRELSLLKKEYDILFYFMQRPGHLVDKTVLAEAVWGDHADQADSFHFLYAQVKNLRRKLAEAGASIEVKAVYGFGYKLVASERLIPLSHETDLSHRAPPFCSFCCRCWPFGPCCSMQRWSTEINDEADDALEDYSELIVTRMLAGRALPSLNSGSNNSYSIAPVDEAYASKHPRIVYYDAEVFIPEKDETEPARILTTVFQDRDGNYFELKVATPTFEKDDLLETILGWVVSLYFLLLGYDRRRDRMGSPPQHGVRFMPCFAGSTATCPGGTILRFRTIRTYRNSAGSTKRRNGPPTVPTSCSIGRSSLSAMPLMSCRRLCPCSETGSNGCWTGPSSRKSKWASCSRCNGRWAASYGSTEPCCF